MLTVLAALTITLLTILTIAVLLTVLTIFGMKICFLVLFRWLTCLAVAYQCAPYTLNGELLVGTLRFYCMEVQTNL